MGLLAKLSGKKTPEKNLPVEPKTDLRLYLENLIEQAKTVDMGENSTVSIMGLPVNPMIILPTIAGQISNELLEKVADMVEMVAGDIAKIRAARVVKILDSEITKNETIADFTEFQED